MATKTIPFDPAEHLADPEDQAELSTTRSIAVTPSTSPTRSAPLRERGACPK
ncbi:MAG TPA: hypothetical protein VGM96_00630 [Reyranella sp.]